MVKFLSLFIVLILSVNCENVVNSEKELNVLEKNSRDNSIIIRTFEQVVKESDLIVEADVKDVKIQLMPKSNLGYAEITLSVNNIIKGNCPDVVTLRRVLINHKYEYLDTDILPVYVKNKKYIICLVKDHFEDYYFHMGMFTGTFEIENGMIIKRDIIPEPSESVVENNTPVEDLIGKIKDIMSGATSKPYSKTTGTIKNNLELKKNAKGEIILGSGSHFSGKFIAFNESWDTNYLLVKFYYNPNGAPADSSTIISRINDAFTPWNNLSLSNLSFYSISTDDITSEGQVDNSTSVIFWYNMGPNYLAREFPNPVEQGPYTKVGSDIGFNTYYNSGNREWYFGSTPLEGRSSEYDYDFADVLVHELGHTSGLADITDSNINYVRMYQYYTTTTITPLRTLADADKAGAVHQHPVSHYSGTLPHSIVLSLTGTNFYLNGDLTIPSGKTFEIESGKTLNLNGYNITNNGTITKNGAINPEIVVVGEDDYYGSVSSAFSAGNSVQIKSNYEGSGFSVPGGKTLTIDAGKNIKIDSGDSIKVLGTLVATGTSNNMITFTKSGTNDWKGIRIESDNITMEYCNIYYADYGIYGIDADNFTLKNSEIACSDIQAVYLIDASDCYLEGNTMESNQSGVKLSHSEAELKENTIDNSGAGYTLYFTSYSIIDLGNSETAGNNVLINSPFYGYGGTAGYWGGHSQGTGKNSIYGCSPLGYLDSLARLSPAEDNWWGDEYVDDDYFDVNWDNGAAIYYEPYLGYDPNLEKVIASIHSIEEDTIKGLYLDAFKQSSLKNYKLAWGKYKEIIEKYPQSYYAISSLIRMDHLKLKLPDEDFVSYLCNLMQENNNLKKTATFISVNHLLDEKYAFDAVENCEYLLRNYPEDLNNNYLLYKLLRINLEYLGDSAKAEEILSELKKKDIKNDFHSLSVGLMEDFKEGKLNRKLTDIELANLSNHRASKSIEKTLETAKLPTTFDLYQNYPNPFNPVTTIKFVLPEVSNVKIRIYNILGQEIETLINENLNAGLHEIKWNASRFASGVYICRLEAGSFSKTIKLLLIK